MNYIDFQGFPRERSSRDFVVKELAIAQVRAGSYHITHHVYASPFSWERISPEMQVHYRKLSKNLHHFKWTDGSRSYMHLANDILNIAYGPTWTSGVKKSIFLTELLGRQVYNLEDLGSPLIQASDTGCAVKNVLLYYNWLKPKFCINLRSEVCPHHSKALKDSTTDRKDSLNEYTCDSPASDQSGWRRGSEAGWRQGCPVASAGTGSQHGSCHLSPRLARVLIKRMRNPRVTLLLYPTGQLSICGARSYSASVKAARRFVAMLHRRVPPQLLPRQSVCVRIKTITAYGKIDLPKALSLRNLCEVLPNAKYEPESFTALVCQLQYCKCTLFHNGSFVLSGAKSKHMLQSDRSLLACLLSN
ncbi:hypothetical protein BOX15_Mlig030348g1 [Macrostomum lignano]|uniref:Uncharacterized protein n=1 Tax=Macrostomum lignano TaxID=282301 RepID=A0A267DYC6_9PLAT|nr:hypothetical protein BOX15_Mlig030348g1 [Macrostomum lignano]